MSKVTQAHIDARMAAIQDAALTLFVRKGIDGTTMQDIAAEAGISAGAIYRYFPSKAHLLQAIFRHSIEQNRLLFDQAVAVSSSPMEALANVGRIIQVGLKSEEMRLHAILGLEAVLAAVRRPEPLAPELARSHDAVTGRLEQLITGAQAAGELDPAVDARALAVLFQSVVVGLQVLSLDREDPVPPEPVFHVIGRMLEGLAPQARSLPESDC